MHCKNKIKSNIAIKHHARQHTEESAFQCYYCELCFFSEKLWSFHNIEMHLEEKDEEGFYEIGYRITSDNRVTIEYKNEQKEDT